MASRKKIAAALIMILVVGALVALIPTVASKILGSHTWYKSPECTKCHTKEKTEIQAGTTTAGVHNKNAANWTQCIRCHSGLQCDTPLNKSLLTEELCHLANRSLALCGSRSGCHNNKSAEVWQGAHGVIASPGSGAKNYTVCIMCHSGVTKVITFKSVTTMNINCSVKNVSNPDQGPTVKLWYSGVNTTGPITVTNTE